MWRRCDVQYDGQDGRKWDRRRQKCENSDQPTTWFRCYCNWRTYRTPIDIHWCPVQHNIALTRSPTFISTILHVTLHPATPAFTRSIIPSHTVPPFITTIQFSKSSIYHNFECLQCENISWFSFVRFVAGKWYPPGAWFIYILMFTRHTVATSSLSVALPYYATFWTSDCLTIFRFHGNSCTEGSTQFVHDTIPRSNFHDNIFDIHC